MHNERIFILDSNLSSAGILGEAINRLGYPKVYLSANRENFAALIQANYFQYVFIDHDMAAMLEEERLMFLMMLLRPYIVLISLDIELNNPLPDFKATTVLA